MNIIETQRLALRTLTEADAPFILELLNEPSFIKNIADRGVRTLEDAARYIQEGPVRGYAANGFGLWRVALQSTDEPLGICGLVRRDTLPGPDIGYAFLPRFWGQGYALEAALATQAYAYRALNLPGLYGVVNPDNTGSIRLLEKLGLTFERMGTLTPGAPELRVYHQDRSKYSFTP